VHGEFPDVITSLDEFFSAIPAVVEKREASTMIKSTTSDGNVSCHISDESAGKMTLTNRYVAFPKPWFH
jgi:hypothetical protein